MSEARQPDEVERAPRGHGRRRRWALPAMLAILGALWATQVRGLVSSNDGSHLALARALALRGEVTIDDEVMLTLLVDRARRGEHDYSDRPPGTAFAALPAVRAAAPLDRRWLAASLSAMRDPAGSGGIEEALVVRPASDRYLHTYGTRRQRVQGPSVNLLALQGTAALVGVHTIALGLVGVALVGVSLRRRGAPLGAQVMAALTLGLATLWGPYSTVLFSHVTAGTMLIGLVIALERLRGAPSSREIALWGGLAGLAGSWSVASDYALAVAVVPLVMLGAPPRRWLPVIVGAVPIAVATLFYHHAAFGSAWSIGYDHQTNFEFARSRAGTFSGNPLEGLWTLWGMGVGAQSPIVWIGALGLALGPRRHWLLGLLPWLVLLTFHRTPDGGATSDHRYLVPALPLFAVGLGHAWQRWVTDDRRGRLTGLGAVAVASISAVLAWSSFWAWRG
jgi:hypothetical protein